MPHSREAVARRQGIFPHGGACERPHSGREVRRYIRPVQEDGYFDERVAARYDEAAAELFDPAVVDPAVDFLVELAGSGRALELGIGTGRIALPLAQRGVPVHGIELSKAMAVRLGQKPGGKDIGVTIGDFATTNVEGTFAVAYVVFNTIGNLTTQAAQVACFRNVAAHLEPGGCFVIELGIPDLQRLPPGDTMRVFHASPTHWGIDEYDVANQRLTPTISNSSKGASSSSRCLSATPGPRNST